MGFQEKHWRQWDQLNTENMHDEDTLALHSTFGGWMGATSKEDRVWHSAAEQLVYQESRWIADYVRKLTDTHEKLKVRKNRYLKIFKDFFKTYPLRMDSCVLMFAEEIFEKHVKGMIKNFIQTVVVSGLRHLRTQVLPVGLMSTFL
jgi:hypothetical protein